MKKKLHKVFLIAGSEPLGSAGMQADIKAITACGGYAACALTGIVDEDTTRVKSITPLPADLVVSQTESFLSDIGAECIKTGVLPSIDIIRGLADKLRDYPDTPKVIDPVLVDSNGVQLCPDENIEAYKELLFPQATLITPNRYEAQVLLGVSRIGEREVRALGEYGCSVIVKSLADGDGLMDVLYDRETDLVTCYRKERIDTHNVNGTGDSFSSAIATYISKGLRLKDAVDKGEEFIDRAIRLGAEYEFGHGYGPVHPCYMDDHDVHERIYY